MQVGWMIAYILDHEYNEQLRNWEDQKDCIRENKVRKYDENLSELDKLGCDNSTLQNVLCARNFKLLFCSRNVEAMFTFSLTYATTHHAVL